MVRQINSRRRRGVILLLFTMMLLFVVLPAVGLAIDAGVLFVVKDKMQTAVDGAALAAARSLSRGTDFTSQQASATTTAKKLYHINMENGFLGVQSAADPTVTFPAGSPQTMVVQVDAVVQAPTFFMRVLGPTSVTMRSRGQTVRRFVNIMVVIDRSGSLGTACAPLRAAATQFIQSFVNGRDKVGLETFGTSYRTDFPIADNFLSATTSITTMVGNITCVGGTNAGAAYRQAYQQLVNLNEPGALNVVLFFTDGLPNALHMPNLEVTANCNDLSGRNGVVEPAGTAVWGIFIANETNPPGQVPNPDWRPIPNLTGCSLLSNYGNVVNDVRELTRSGLTAAQEIDALGTNLNGWKSVSRDTSNRITLTASNLTNAGINVLVNAANLARNNATLNIATYAIGLGDEVDADVLNRVANVPGSTYYDSTKTPGKFIFAADSSQLQSAFGQLASEMLRIAQ
jgi:Flp pilus assembly protein TadG